jgi:hypothetical protein
MTINLPSPDSHTYSSLPSEARQEVRDWIDAFQTHPFQKPIGQWITTIANHIGKSPATVRRKYDEYRRTGSWKTFVPKHRLPKAATHIRTRHESFRNHLATLAEGHQRNSTAAIRKLKRQWKDRTPIPAYEDFPGWPTFPDGWSDRNLARIIQQVCDARALKSMRHGTSSKTNPLLPQVHLTRVGLYPGAVYQLDDVWHDHFVTLGRNPKPVRVLELGVLDLFSGCRFHWGTKPRTKRDDGTHQNLNEREMRFFLAALLLNFGYSQRGTQLMVEYGTAAIREDVERILRDDTGGLVSVVRQPIEGGQQALTSFWPGSEGGNFRAKASLESLHNLIHNDLAHLGLQAGKNRDSRPVVTDRQLSYITKIVQDVAKVNPAAVDALQLPGLDYHTQFLPFLNDYYRHGLNARTDHQLQGWAELGHLVTEYTAVPGSDHFLTTEQFLALPEVSRRTLSAAAQQDPRAYTRKRALSPAEVWEPAVPNLRKIQPHTVCDILSQDLARDVKVRGSYIEFSDQDISPEPLIYTSRLRTLEGAMRELSSGSKYSAFANPFAPRFLFICDSRGTCLGTCELVERVSYTDRQGIAEASGHKRQRTADILQPTRQRQAGQVQAAQDMRDHNRRLRDGEPTDPAERRTQAAAKAADTRQTNRVHTRAATRDTAEALEAWSTPDPTPEDQPDQPDDTSFNPFSE